MAMGAGAISIRELGAMHAVAEAARNVACSGATPVGATNCLNFGNPEKPHIMWQFSQMIDGITKACEELEIPITGGNVSFYNETLGEGIYPTPVLGVVGILEDVHKARASGFQRRGRTIVLLRGSEPGDATDAEVGVWLVRVCEGNSGSGVGISSGAGSGKEAALQKALIEIDSDETGGFCARLLRGRNRRSAGRVGASLKASDAMWIWRPTGWRRNLCCLARTRAACDLLRPR